MERVSRALAELSDKKGGNMNDTTWHGLIEKCETCANYRIMDEDDIWCAMSQRAVECSVWPYPYPCGGYFPDFWQTHWVMSEEWFNEDIEVTKRAFKEAERLWREIL